MKKTILALLSIVLLSAACKESDNNDAMVPTTSGRSAYIINEGNFGSGNGSISRIDLSNGNIVHDIFSTANNRPLGDVVQSMTIADDKAYIVVNNSQKIEIVNKGDFSSSFLLGGLTSPREIKVLNQKAYITEWVDNKLKIIDLSTNTITKEIVCGEGPEQMEIIGNKIFVCNSGGFGGDSTIFVFDVVSEQVTDTIYVGYKPSYMEVDKNGKIWVLCRGALGPDWTPGTADDIAGSLHRVDPQSNTIEASFPMAPTDHPINLKINGAGDRLYYINTLSDFTGKPRTMGINDASLPTSAILNRLCYGLGVDPVDGTIYCTVTPSFSLPGTVIRLNSTNYSVIDSITAGIGPGNIVFD